MLKKRYEILREIISPFLLSHERSRILLFPSSDDIDIVVGTAAPDDVAFRLSDLLVVVLGDRGRQVPLFLHFRLVKLMLDSIRRANMKMRLLHTINTTHPRFLTLIQASKEKLPTFTFTLFHQIYTQHVLECFFPAVDKEGTIHD